MELKKKEIIKEIAKAIDSENYYILVLSDDKLGHWVKNIELATIDHKLHQLQFCILFDFYYNVKQQEDKIEKMGKKSINVR